MISLFNMALSLSRVYRAKFNKPSEVSFGMKCGIKTLILETEL